jgi:hypothetical protein
MIKIIKKIGKHFFRTDWRNGFKNLDSPPSRQIKKGEAIEEKQENTCIYCNHKKYSSEPTPFNRKVRVSAPYIENSFKVINYYCKNCNYNIYTKRSKIV